MIHYNTDEVYDQDSPVVYNRVFVLTPRRSEMAILEDAPKFGVVANNERIRWRKNVIELVGEHFNMQAFFDHLSKHSVTITGASA